MRTLLLHRIFIQFLGAHSLMNKIEKKKRLLEQKMNQLKER